MSEARYGGWDASRSAAGHHNPWLIAGVVSIATFMQVLDTAIANVALRHIAGSLGAGIDESTWVVTTYLVASAAIIPVSGWLSSVVGRKRYYMGCVAIFTVASVLCGFAPNLTSLIVFRILQGLGGGGMAPSEQAILTDTFPPWRRAQAYALYGIAVIVAPTIGPTLGGWITDNYSWHWIFFINGPVGVISLFLVQWLVVEPAALVRERKQRIKSGIKVDWIGFLLVALFLGCLEVVLDRGQQEDWFNSGFIIFFSLLSALSLVALIPWEMSRDDPIVNIRLLFHRQFGAAFVVMLTVGIVLFGSTQFTPQLLQQTFQYTAELSGLALMPGGVAMLIMMPVAGQISSYVQPKYLMCFGMFCVALAMWHMTSIDPFASFNWFAWMRILQVFSLPLLFVPINTVAYSELRPEDTAQASALINVARNLGGSIGISMASTILAQRSQFHQARLSEHIYASSPTVQQMLAQMTAYLVSHGYSAADAKARAFGLIGQTIAFQASLMSYIDVFLGAAVFAGLMIPVTLIIRNVRVEGNRHA
jgi:DHA2 family multidrug resistance protein